jgi:hypothetical protein
MTTPLTPDCVQDTHSKACLPQGMTGVYKSPYGGREYTTVADSAGGNAQKCAAVAEGVLEVGKACEVEPVSECSFAGAWGGGWGHPERPSTRTRARCVSQHRA